MDKCLPVIDLFSNGQRDSGSVSEDVSSPIIWEDMSVFYLRQLASSLQVRAGVMKVPQNPPATPNAATPNDRALSPNAVFYVHDLMYRPCYFTHTPSLCYGKSLQR